METKVKKYYVYALQDPDSGKTMYVGQASDANRRLKEHMQVAMSADKHVWINSLIEKGGKPILWILEEVKIKVVTDDQGKCSEDKEDLHFAEEKWIRKYRPKFNRTKPKKRFIEVLS